MRRSYLMDWMALEKHWAEIPLSRVVIEQLATAAFMETAHNLILVGGTGTGK